MENRKPKTGNRKLVNLAAVKFPVSCFLFFISVRPEERLLPSRRVSKAVGPGASPDALRDEEAVSSVRAENMLQRGDRS